MKKTDESSFATLSLKEKARAMAAHPDPERLMNYLLGQVMARTGGKANPHIVRQLILERLDKESDV